MQWEQTSWVIREAGCSSGPGIKVDALVIQPKGSSPGNIRGYIVAVHGVDQEVAKQLGYADLKLLGVGSHLTQRIPQRTCLLHLLADGRVEKGE